MISTMRIYVYVPEGVVGLIHRGMPAILTVQGLGSRKYKGTVTRFADSLDLSTRTMLTEIDIKNPRHDLYPGMYANVTLELQRHPNAIKVPDSAVSKGPQGSFVYVVEGGRLRRLRVTTGIADMSKSPPDCEAMKTWSHSSIRPWCLVSAWWRLCRILRCFLSGPWPTPNSS
jgi:multidrug efflux pump subunit AcrA (membrane-fusion protein)